MSTTTTTTSTVTTSTDMTSCTATLSSSNNTTSDPGVNKHINSKNEDSAKESPFLSSLSSEAYSYASSSMGLSRVLSDEKHYGTFLCPLCESLLSLDAVVTNACSHAVCWSCLQAHVERQIIEQRNQQQQNREQKRDSNHSSINSNNENHHIQQPIPCPQCSCSLLESSTSSSSQEKTVLIARQRTTMNMQVRIPTKTSTKETQQEEHQMVSLQLAVQRLEMAQPMAFRAMSWIQVCCSPRNHNDVPKNRKRRAQCRWEGDYGEYPNHLALYCESAEPTCSSVNQVNKENNGAEGTPLASSSENRPTVPELIRTKSMPSLFHPKPKHHPSFAGHITPLGGDKKLPHPWPLDASGSVNGDVRDRIPQQPLKYVTPPSGRRNSAGGVLMSHEASGSLLSRDALLSPSSTASSAVSRNNITSNGNWSSADSMDSNGPPLFLRKSFSLRNISRDSVNDFPPPAPLRTKSPYGPAEGESIKDPATGVAGSDRSHKVDVGSLPNIPRWEDSKSTTTRTDKINRKNSNSVLQQTIPENCEPTNLTTRSSKANSKNNNSQSKETNESLLRAAKCENGESIAVAPNNSIGGYASRDTAPNLVKRTKSGMGPSSDGMPSQSNHEEPLQPSVASSNNNSKQQQQQNSNGTTNKPVTEDKVLRRSRRKSNQPPPVTNTTKEDSGADDDDSIADRDDHGSSEENWFNTSMNSLMAGGSNNAAMTIVQASLELTETNNGSPRPSTSSTHQVATSTPVGRNANRMGVSSESASSQSQLLPSPSATSDRTKVQSTLAKIEKLKKQAIAKFNEGDSNASRSLYTDGIRYMEAVPNRGPREAEILSSMYSNRSVTYFREKDFLECINDCDRAIHFDPLLEKSYIRKWRALMALGHFERALDCLETGLHLLPDSNKIRKELQKTQGEMETARQAKELLFQKGDYLAVKEMLAPHMKSAAMDNIAILHLAARADAYLGLMDSSVQKIDRAMRYNPLQPDGLAVRGAILYLTGETDKGLLVLQDAYGRDKENRSIKTEMQQCQRTHVLLTKGRSCVKRARYLDAVEHFTAVIREKTLVPEKTPLYAMIRCERAEAWMMSRKYSEALKDCRNVINAQGENATAWTMRADILVAMGKAEEAQKELLEIRKTWGMDNSTIEEGYRRVDFELRVQKADEELSSFVATLEQGLGFVRPAASRRGSEGSLSNNNRRSSRYLNISNAGSDARAQRRASTGRRGSVGSSESYGAISASSVERRQSLSGAGEQQHHRGTRWKNQSSRSISSAATVGGGGNQVPESDILPPVPNSNSCNGNNNTSSGNSPPTTPQRRQTNKNGALRRAASGRRLLAAALAADDPGGNGGGGGQPSLRRSLVERQASRQGLTQGDDAGGGGGGGGGGGDGATVMPKQGSRRYLSSEPPKQDSKPNRRMSTNAIQAHEHRTVARRLSLDRVPTSTFSSSTTTDKNHVERSNVKRSKKQI